MRDYTRINLRNRRNSSLARRLPCSAWQQADRKAALIDELERQGVLLEALAEEVDRPRPLRPAAACAYDQPR